MILRYTIVFQLLFKTDRIWELNRIDIEEKYEDFNKLKKKRTK